jgi:hypothetical protein
MNVELWQVGILRKVLDGFCSNHGLETSDATAIKAAEMLMKFVREGECDPVQLRSRLDTVHVSSNDRRPQAQGAEKYGIAIP